MLESAGCWVGLGLCAKMVTSRRVHAGQYSLGSSTTSDLITTSLGEPSRPTGRSGPDSYGVTALPWAPVHVKPCLHPPRVECLFPLSPVEVPHTSPAGLQSQML